MVHLVTLLWLQYCIYSTLHHIGQCLLSPLLLVLWLLFCSELSLQQQPLTPLQDNAIVESRSAKATPKRVLLLIVTTCCVAVCRVQRLQTLLHRALLVEGAYNFKSLPYGMSCWNQHWSLVLFCCITACIVLYKENLHCSS